MTGPFAGPRGIKPQKSIAVASVQLSLFPQRGFGLLALGSELLVDLSTGDPIFRRSQRAARSLLDNRKRTPQWVALYACVVPITIHEDSDEDGRPTYVIGDSP